MLSSETSSIVAGYVALFAAGLSIGYWAGAGSTRGPDRLPESLPNLNDARSEAGDSDISSTQEDGNLSEVKADVKDDCKLVTRRLDI